MKIIQIIVFWQGFRYIGRHRRSIADETTAKFKLYLYTGKLHLHLGTMCQAGFFQAVHGTIVSLVLNFGNESRAPLVGKAVSLLQTPNQSTLSTNTEKL